MMNGKNEVLKLRFMLEETRLRANCFLIRNTSLETEDVMKLKEIYLAIQYANSIMQRHIELNGISKEDLSERERLVYENIESLVKEQEIFLTLTETLFADMFRDEGSE